MLKLLAFFVAHNDLKRGSWHQEDKDATRDFLQDWIRRALGIIFFSARSNGNIARYCTKDLGQLDYIKFFRAGVYC